MSLVAERLAQVRLGEPQTHLNLSLFPLCAEGPDEPAYLLLDEALARDCARVTEVSASGSVPELKFVNDGDHPVLLLDGEELVGAKQNRILNLTVLVPAHQTLVIPVSCVEAGRWHAQSAEFKSAGRTHYATGRAHKAAQVSESLSCAGSRQSDQSAVWADISAKSQRMHAFSDTAAAAALYETHRVRLDDYLGAFPAVEEQIGALFVINGQVIGLDLFDTSHTLSALLRKLVESYALDAIDTGQKEVEPPRPDHARQFLDEVAQASWETFPALGAGEDLRLRGEHLTGGALVVNGQIVHLCAFHLNAREAAGSGSEGSHLARASLRGRGKLRD